MKQIPRISPEEAREKVISGTALLVCAHRGVTPWGRRKVDEKGSCLFSGHVVSRVMRIFHASLSGLIQAIGDPSRP